MAKKPVILDQADLTKYLRQRYVKARTLADAANITTAHAYNLFEGSRPSPAILKRLGISLLYQVEATK